MYIIRSIMTMLLMVCCISINAQVEIDTISYDVYEEGVAEIENTLAPSQQILEQSPDFRIPSEKKIEEFQNDKRFQYEKTKPKEIGLWDKLKYWLLEKIGRITLGVTQSGILSIIVILAAIAIVVFIIIKLTGVKFRSIFGKQKLDMPAINIYSENVHEMDFETLIENALKNKDYRLAVRFMYLKNLKKLTDSGIINWSINKTNYSYQYEIANDTLRNKFLNTTFIFDYVWYGEFPIDETNFSRAYNELTTFNEMIGK